MSGVLTWFKQRLIKFQEQRPQTVTENSLFRLINHVENYIGKYDGREHSFDVQVVDDCLLEFSSDGELWNKDKPKLVNAGKYIFYVKAKRNNRIEQTKASIVILKRRVQLVSESCSKEYDGLPVKAEKIEVIGDGFADNTKVNFFFRDGQTQVGSCENKFTYTFDKANDACNYEISVAYGELTVSHRKERIPLEINAQSIEYVYDGKSKCYKENLDAYVKVHNLEYRVTGLVSEFSGKDAGSYKTTITGEPVISDLEGHNVSDEFNVHVIPGGIVIQKQKIILKSSSIEKQYDGKEISFPHVDVEGCLYEGDIFHAAAIGKIKRPGSVANSIIYGFDNNGTERNYEISLQEGTLIVHKNSRPLEAEIFISGNEHIYDGISHDFSFTVKQDVVVNGVSYHVTGVSGILTACDVGEYNYKIVGIPKVIDEDGYDVSELILVKVIAGKCIINPRIVNLKSETLTVEYSGEPAYASNVWVSGDGFINEDIISCQAIGNLCLPGKTKNSIIVQYISDTKANNYRLFLDEGIICVLDRIEKYLVTLDVEDVYKIYAGSELVLDTQITKQISVGKVNYTVTVPRLRAAGKNVGEYNFQIIEDPIVIDDHKNDVSKQFKIELGKGKLIITPRRIRVTSSSVKKEYDGTPLCSEDICISGDGIANTDKVFFSATGTQLLPGTSLNLIEYHFDNPNIKNNYEVEIIPGELEILHRRKKFEITFKPEDEEYVYDGKEHQIKGHIDYTIYALDNVYTVKGAEYHAALVHSGKIETAFSGIPRVLDEYKNDVSSEFDVILEPGVLFVKPRTVTIISASHEQEYNGRFLTDRQVNFEGDGFLEGETPDINVLGSQKIPGISWNLFEYVLPEGVHPEDYDIYPRYGALEVRNRTVKYVVDVALKRESYVYDGKVHSVKGIENKYINVEGVSYKIQERGVAVTGISAGTYFYENVDSIIILDDGNDVSNQFDIHIVPGSLTIIPRSLVIVSSSESKEYDGKSLTNDNYELLGDGLVYDKDISIKTTGKQLLPGISENTIEYSFMDGEENNYEVTTLCGKLEVTNRQEPFEVTLRGESHTVIYDKISHTLPEFPNLQFEIDGVWFEIKGISNVITGTEEGTYVSLDSDKPYVLDEYDNDVTDQFHIVVQKGTLKIEHNPAFDIDDKPDSYDIAIQDIIDQVSGDQTKSSEREVKKYSRQQLENMYVDTIALLKGKGEVKPIYTKLLKKVEENNELARLHNRIIEEFKDVTLLSEIEINDDEFEILKSYFRQKYIIVRRNNKSSFVDILFSIMMVQIGIRYYENNYWPQVAAIMGVKEIAQANRSWVGGTVTDTLLAFGKPVYSETEYVSNILMHSFVTDPFSMRFFDYLFLYYSNDLNRDITGLQDADLEYVCDSIVNPYAKRKQLLSKYMAMSVRGAKDYCKTIIWKTLQMIDCSFWDEPYGAEILEGRLREHFEYWKEVSEFYQPERKKHQGEVKRNRQFRTPYFYWDMAHNEFEVILPPQLVRVRDEDNLPEVRWYIVTVEKQEYSCGLVEGYSGYKTKELCIKTDVQTMFQRHVFLLFAEKTLVRAFNIDENSILFFDEKGRWITGESLDVGITYAIGKNDSEVTSDALLNKSNINGLKLFELDLHKGDFVCVKDGANYYVGKVPAVGLTDRAVVPNVLIKQDNEIVSVYSDYPTIIIDVNDNQYNGVAIIINSSVNRLSQAIYMDVHFGKTTDQKYYFIDLRHLVGNREGFNRIVVDYPGTSKRMTLVYYYSPGFYFEFPGAPYVYQDTGMLRINRVLEDNEIDLETEVDHAEMSFNLSDVENGRLAIKTIGGAVLEFTVPALFVSWDRKLWRYQKLKDIWHADFKSVCYLMYPDKELKLCVNGTNKAHSVQIYKKRLDGIFDCDLTKLKSYFSKEKIIETILLLVGSKEIPLLRIIQKSILHAASLRINVDNAEIVATLDIFGKNNYYADLYCEETLVADKIPVTNGEAIFSTEIQTAKYTVIVYELDNSFDFDEEYEYVGEREVSLINPKDMVGACMKLKGISKKGRQLKPGEEYHYYLFIDSQLEDYKYIGLIVGLFHRKVMYASKVCLKDIDPNNMNQIMVSRLTEDNKLDSFLYRTDKRAIIDIHNKGREKAFEVVLLPFEDPWLIEHIDSKEWIEKAGKEWLDMVERSRKRGFSIWKS